MHVGRVQGLTPEWPNNARDRYIIKSGVRPLCDHSEPQYCSEPISARSKTLQQVISGGKTLDHFNNWQENKFATDWLNQIE